MSDFRTDLYDRYVTTFKGSQFDESALQEQWKWCEYKYLPLFREVKSDESILELGCGPGHMLQFLKNHGFSNVYGIDISGEQIELAKERGLQAEVADVFEFLASHNQEFKIIIAIDFAEHFSKEELSRLFPILLNALQPGGFLILQTPNGAGLFSDQIVYGDLTHLTIFSPGSLQQILRLNGFDEIRFWEAGPVPKDLKGRVRSILWKIVRTGSNILRAIESGKTQKILTENIICRCRRPLPDSII